MGIEIEGNHNYLDTKLHKDSIEKYRSFMNTDTKPRNKILPNGI